MKTEKTESGLIIPVCKPKEIKRFPLLEIQDEDHRHRAIGAMRELWDVLELIEGPGDYGLCPNASQAAHYHTWSFFGKMILGEDCPFGEEWT